jgi:hypothetical protein
MRVTLDGTQILNLGWGWRAASPRSLYDMGLPDTQIQRVVEQPIVNPKLQNFTYTGW